MVGFIKNSWKLLHKLLHFMFKLFKLNNNRGLFFWCKSSL